MEGVTKKFYKKQRITTQKVNKNLTPEKSKELQSILNTISAFP